MALVLTHVACVASALTLNSISLLTSACSRAPLAGVGKTNFGKKTPSVHVVTLGSTAKKKEEENSRDVRFELLAALTAKGPSLWTTLLDWFLDGFISALIQETTSVLTDC